MLSFNLQAIFKTRGIENPYRFLVKAGISPNTANKIAYDKMSVIRLDHIELICTLLVCEPNDLLLWTPNAGKVYADDFPLAKLNRADLGSNWHQSLAKIPLQRLKEVTKTILNTGKEGEKNG